MDTIKPTPSTAADSSRSPKSILSDGIFNELEQQRTGGDGEVAKSEIVKEEGEKMQHSLGNPIKKENSFPIDDLTPQHLPSTLLPSQFLSPLRETHIFTPVKGAVPISVPVIPVTGDNEGGVVGEADSISSHPAPADVIVVKEYRDVEYDPSKFLGELLGGERVTEKKEIIGRPMNDQLMSEICGEAANDQFGDFESGHPNGSPMVIPQVTGNPFSITANDEDEEQEEAEDEFSDFQSVPVAVPPETNSSSVVASSSPKRDPLAVLSVNSLSSMLVTSQGKDENILRPSILMPQPVGTMRKETIQWPDNSDQIAQSELERFDEIFSYNKKQQPQPQTQLAMNSREQERKEVTAGSQVKEEDEWSDFVSVPSKSSPKKVVSNNVKAPSPIEDDWTEFVSSTPSTQSALPPPAGGGPNFTPWGASANYSSFSQAPIPSRPTTHLPPPRFNGAELQFVDPAPFFISSTAAGLQSMFGGGGAGSRGGERGSSYGNGTTGRK